MVVKGTVVNGTIVLDESVSLPEGARVDVHVAGTERESSALAEVLLRHSGKAQGLPKDMAQQHDHYLHGTPKR